MSIVCAHAGSDGVFIASDRRVTLDDGGSLLEARPKFFLRPGWGIGMVGEAVLHDVVEEALDYLLTSALGSAPRNFARRLGLRLREQGWKTRDQAGAPVYPDVTVLLARVADNHLYVIGETLDVIEVEQFAAVGSGDRHAYGAWHALRQSKLSWEGVAVVRVAVESACAFDPACGGEPFIARVE